VRAFPAQRTSASLLQHSPAPLVHTPKQGQQPPVPKINLRFAKTLQESQFPNLPAGPALGYLGG
jgi:hypothetical protein